MSSENRTWRSSENLEDLDKPAGDLPGRPGVPSENPIAWKTWIAWRILGLEDLDSLEDHSLEHLEII